MWLRDKRWVREEAACRLGWGGNALLGFAALNQTYKLFDRVLFQVVVVSAVTVIWLSLTLA